MGYMAPRKRGFFVATQYSSYGGLHTTHQGGRPTAIVITTYGVTTYDDMARPAPPSGGMEPPATQQWGWMTRANQPARVGGS